MGPPPDDGSTVQALSTPGDSRRSAWLKRRRGYARTRGSQNGISPWCVQTRPPQLTRRSAISPRPTSWPLVSVVRTARSTSSSSGTGARYQLCYRFVGNHEDAAISRRTSSSGVSDRKFGGRSSLATWLYRIAVNVSLNRVSAKKRQSEPLDARQHVDTRTESPSERLIGAERDARVRAAIAQLPRKQRVALILRMYHEMSHQEIADVVGGSVGAVKANVFHALQNLKKRLAGETV